ncbi:hypothetical protein BGW36DRAFT_370126 [Talaromyces proteolyticus]|uniref:Tim44-like domain-containing protein n=1 Tax=Talaromyces proteolyticus TaxID=1131652 RepID=A0AAD4KYG9_9EURO|nr:uncharacterized protein BGW36DRAFT_370126 [Talaromyces proteolyticus]KAH8703871.1 hypothetical protein BGW36DRAFT_370126 [Talaromyces proteolyticus]
MASSIGLTRHLHRATTAPRFQAYHRSLAISYHSKTRSSNTQYRSFSQTCAPKAKGIPQTMTMKIPAQVSPKSRMREMSPDTMPTDFGLLPGTFVKPEGKDMPAFFKEPQLRLRMEWVWIKQWVANFIATIAYHKYYFKKLPLELKERKGIAKRLHRIMYTEFAGGNEAALKEICCTGLETSLLSRLRRRPANEKVSWKMSYIRSPSTFYTGARVVSDRATKIPDLPDSGLRQVVVRICSHQNTASYSERLSEDREQTFVTPRTEKAQAITEYVVIQKLRINGEDVPWKIWGFTKPTTVDELDSHHFSGGLSAKERLEMMQETLSGKK